jgi:hypothetical protein
MAPIWTVRFIPYLKLASSITSKKMPISSVISAFYDGFDLLPCENGSFPFDKLASN